MAVLSLISVVGKWIPSSLLLPSGHDEAVPSLYYSLKLEPDLVNAF